MSDDRQHPVAAADREGQGTASASTALLAPLVQHNTLLPTCDYALVK